MWKPLATLLTLLILCPPLFAAQRSIIVLDASGSMWG
ncbi:hypothetical protein Thivi_2822 [Thiocystis violascens DSM 198]|uniref:Uncharacterized protein n=1 Tax=Thiocystis violascens (strain ATCC 17096 / DSM 198 / 6111) TaxID=765911 RepID=I3YCM0_THIV6|nr:hypothetical protein Thivi_2822 [Thiocystis violascens DSM 198]